LQTKKKEKTNPSCKHHLLYITSSIVALRLTEVLSTKKPRLHEKESGVAMFFPRVLSLSLDISREDNLLSSAGALATA